MRRLAGIAMALAVGSTAAVAQGVKDYDKPVLWTGLYIGAHGGYAWGTADGKLEYDPGLGPIDIWGDKAATSIDLKGSYGGVQIGFNQQVGALVVGLEVDGSWGGIKGDKNHVLDIPDEDDKPDYSWRIKPKIDAFGTVRGRIGLLAAPGLLIYGTGGLAIARVSSSLTVTGHEAQGFDPPTVTAVGSATENMIGWTAGAGTEWMMGGGWSLKAEYLYVDLGTATFRMKGTAYPDKAPCVGPISSSCSFPHTTDSLTGTDVTFHTVRMGLNYKF